MDDMSIMEEVGRETLHRMLYYMKLHRVYEDRIEVVYRQGKLAGPVFLGRGQEAVGVGSAIQLGKDDFIETRSIDPRRFRRCSTTTTRCRHSSPSWSKWI